MTADRYERYELDHVPDGLSISTWQILPRVGAGVIALVMLAACFATDPYEGHSRIWAELGVVTLALVAIFGVSVERWIIGDAEVRHKSSLWSREASFVRSANEALILRLENLPADSEGNRPPYPHVVHLIGTAGAEIGAGFGFRDRSTRDRFLDTLRTFTPIDLQEAC
jgi:hypothetical protein